MKKVSAITAVLVLLGGAGLQADVLHMSTGLTSLEMVEVGDVGNRSDTRYGRNHFGSGPIGWGGVSYAYRMGKYEVTAAQYAEFLNCKAKSDPYGLWNSKMDVANNWNGCNITRSGTDGDYRYSITADWANRPVNYVSYWDACRFANWLNNGQGSGDTETGAYTLNGYVGSDGRSIHRNAGATWFLPSQDEWYKTAYYKGHGLQDGYWEYPTQSNETPGRKVVNPDPGNSANYFYASGDFIHYRTVVGEFENSAGAYGTFDQAGNVSEWNEGLWGDHVYRGLRGSNFTDNEHPMLASFFASATPSNEAGVWGFRVASVPEPSSVIAMAFGLLGVAGFLRRR